MAQESDDFLATECLSEEESTSNFETVTKDMTVKDVCSYLEGKGIPSHFCKAFQDNYIDGMEFHLLKEDDVKAMVPPIGLAKKIIRLLPKHTDSELVLPPTTPPATCPDMSSSAVSTPLSEVSTSESVSLSNMSKGPGDIEIPDHWRPEVDFCIKEKNLCDRSRSEIVRTLVNLLYARASRPTKYQCEELSRKLILKYPFMRDDMGNGYQSWSDKMVERIRNIRKSDSRKMNKSAASLEDEGMAPPMKKKKRSCELVRRYPTASNIDLDNAESIEKHMHAISNELLKSRPRDTVLLPLMKSTYPVRRLFVLNEDTVSMNIILEKYPALSRPAVIEQEMCLINGNNDIKNIFLQHWITKYVPAIISYGQTSSKKNVKSCLDSLDVTDETSKQITALKILTESFSKSKQVLCYLYEEYLDSDTVDSACKTLPKRTQPRIAAFISEGAITEYLILCENRCLCKCTNLQAAIFIMFSCYYCFHLDYPKQAKIVFEFFQDYVLGHPDSNCKKSGTYLAIVSDIKRNL